jgi:hypothetical protein
LVDFVYLADEMNRIFISSRSRGWKLYEPKSLLLLIFNSETFIWDLVQMCVRGVHFIKKNFGFWITINTDKHNSFIFVLNSQNNLLFDRCLNKKS